MTQFVAGPMSFVSREQTLLQNNHNVYILGAGFSADRGVPTVPGFLSRMREALSDCQDNLSARAIERVMRFRRDAASASDRISLDIENIEQLFSLATFDRDVEIVGSIPRAIGATIDFAMRTQPAPQVHVSAARDANDFWPNAWSGAGTEVQRAAGVRVDAYEAHLATMLGILGNQAPKCRNTFITFNYDLVVEGALWELGERIDYGLLPTIGGPIEGAESSFATNEEPGVELLKLHGSVNWGTSSSRVVRDNRRGTTSPWVWLHPDYGSIHDHAHSVLLVPPTWSKSVSGPLQPVWQRAVDAISTATRIAVIGYSVPDTDTHFRYLLAAGLKENISLREVRFVDLVRFGERSPGRTSPVERRMRALVQPQHWASGRAKISLEGAAPFIQQWLPSEFHRPRAEGFSFRV